MSGNDEGSGPKWGLLIFGILIVILAFYLFSVFAGLEKSGGSMRINWIVAGLYKLLGKWGVAIVTGLLGLAVCWWSFVYEEPEE
jgi:hypothetical protein